MLQPIICNFGLFDNMHLGLQHLTNRKEGRISDVSSHKFQKVPKCQCCPLGLLSCAKDIYFFAAIWSQKISSFREILAEGSYTQTVLEQLLRYDWLHFCKDWFRQELWREGCDRSATFLTTNLVYLKTARPSSTMVT